MAISCSDLYRRLRDHGFDRKFVKDVVLPDWWEDSLATNPANRALAEAAIARYLGFKISQLRNPENSLSAPPASNFCFKRLRRTKPSEIMPAAIVAQKAAKLIADHLSGVSKFIGIKSAQQIRNSILGDSLVNLYALVRYCWHNGIAVIHIVPDRLPRLSKKFQGVCLYCSQTPVVVLGSGKTSPPWLAFDLAHEIGHIMLGHVKADDRLLVDLDIDSRVGNDQQDKDANTFATEVLTGQKRMQFKEQGLTSPNLASEARTYGHQNAIDPGTVALIYGRSADRWSVAQNALKYLGESTGAHEFISQSLKEHVAVDGMTESTVRFLSSLAAFGSDANG